MPACWIDALFEEVVMVEVVASADVALGSLRTMRRAASRACISCSTVCVNDVANNGASWSEAALGAMPIKARMADAPCNARLQLVSMDSQRHSKTSLSLRLTSNGAAADE